MKSYNKFYAPKNKQRLYTKCFAIGAPIIAVAAIATAIGVQSNASADANAQTSVTILDNPTTGGIIASDELDAKKSTVEGLGDLSESTLGQTPIENLPTVYNSHDTYHTYTYNKNQNTEGLCWLYAASTTLEYTLEKTDRAATVSPKHIDYQFVDSAEAYKGENPAANLYYDKWLDAVNDPSYSRSLGDGGNYYTILLTLSNPLSLVSDSYFAGVLKNNDSRVSSISKYEDIWTLPNYELLLNEDGAYVQKQTYNEINNASASDYMVTSLKEIYDNSYGSDDEKTQTVNSIKQAIYDYGAAEVITFFDQSNCMYQTVDTQNETITATVIDKTNSTCANDSGHAMTLIGWDDNWSYKDGDTDKQGAFIVQNSWGNTRRVDVGGTVYNYTAYYYMGYDSAFDVLYADSIENTSDYDHIYSLKDYNTATITQSDTEYVFEYTSAEKEILREITFNENLTEGLSYKVEVSTTGAKENFKTIGTITASRGINRLKLTDSSVVLNGNYAIRLTILNGDHTISNDERILNIANVYTTNAPTATISFNANSGQGGQTANVTATYGFAMPTISTTAPTRAGYEFMGWFDGTDYTTSTQYYNPDGSSAKKWDKENTSEMTLYAGWMETSTGRIVWESGQTYTKDSGTNMVLRIIIPLSEFTDVTMDGVALTQGVDYTAQEGSTIITIFSSFLQNLTTGTHTIAANFTDDRTITTQFTVSDPDVTSGDVVTTSVAVPNTGSEQRATSEASVTTTDNKTAIILAASAIAVASVIIITRIILKKHRN